MDERERLLRRSRIERQGLKAGTTAPTFTLPDLEGGLVSLEAYRGRPVLLVFSDPECAPCTDVLSSLKGLHTSDVLLVGRGDPEANRAKLREVGLNLPMVLQQKWEISKAYGIFAIPVGFLIDATGAIAQDVATGHEAILALARSISRGGP